MSTRVYHIFKTHSNSLYRNSAREKSGVRRRGKKGFRVRMVSCAKKLTLASQIERRRSIARRCQGYREISCRGTFLLVLQNDTTFESIPTSVQPPSISCCDRSCFYPEISPIIPCQLASVWFINRDRTFLPTFCNKNKPLTSNSLSGSVSSDSVMYPANMPVHTP